MNSPFQANFKQGGKKKLDLAYLFADPLVERVKDELLPISSPLDTEVEFKEIYKIL
jgi:hypothetical protein